MFNKSELSVSLGRVELSHPLWKCAARDDRCYTFVLLRLVYSVQQV